ncbi:MAG: site-specific integrase [Planctomycetia bacterium]|nr:site-specific integrase [Planctomycetia bacterium]
MNEGNKPGTNRVRRPKRKPGPEYDVASYRRSIEYAIAAANAGRKEGEPEIPPWHPHQLRHNAATSLRREFGIEVARIILGHATAFTTEIYAEADREAARAAIGKVG